MSLDRNKLDELETRINSYEEQYRAGRKIEGEFGERCLSVIDDRRIITMDESQRNYFKQMFDSMDAITAVHVIETSDLAKNFINTYNKQYGEGSFSRDFKVNEDNFIMGMLLHDSGKVFVDPELLLTSRRLSDDEKLKVSQHDVDAIYGIYILNQKANPNKDISEVFSVESTNIALYHHPKDNVTPELRNDILNVDKLKKPYLFVSAEIDIYESSVSDTRIYKKPATPEEAKKNVNYNIEDYAESFTEKASEINETLPSCYDSEFHKQITNTFEKDISVTGKVSNIIDDKCPKILFAELSNQVLYEVIK